MDCTIYILNDDLWSTVLLYVSNVMELIYLSQICKQVYRLAIKKIREEFKRINKMHELQNRMRGYRLFGGKLECIITNIPNIRNKMVFFNAEEYKAIELNENYDKIRLSASFNAYSVHNIVFKEVTIYGLDKPHVMNISEFVKGTPPFNQIKGEKWFKGYEIKYEQVTYKIIFCVGRIVFSL